MLALRKGAEKGYQMLIAEELQELRSWCYANYEGQYGAVSTGASQPLRNQFKPPTPPDTIGAVFFYTGLFKSDPRNK